jgi:glycosyltransferase involved in cell wall biosynthesis
MRLTVLNVSYSLGCVSPRTAGGAEHVLLTLDRYLSCNGHRSLVIAPTGSRTHGLLLATPRIEGDLDEDAKIRARANHARAIRRALAMFPIDIIHLHGVDFFDYLPENQVAVVVTLHLPLNWYPRSALSLRRASTHLVSVSRSQCAARPENAVITRVIPNGVEVGINGFPRRKGSYVASVGRICPEKGFHLAMDAATGCGLPLYLAGEVAGYPEHRRYFEGKIQPRFGSLHRWLGAISSERKRHLMAGARAVLIPSLVPETSSLVAMEAIASGTPVIAYPQGALSEIVTHGKTGFLVNTVNEMRDAIVAADEIDPGPCVREANARFSAAHMVESYTKLYQDAAFGPGEAWTELRKAA